MRRHPSTVLCYSACDGSLLCNKLQQIELWSDVTRTHASAEGVRDNFPIFGDAVSRHRIGPLPKTDQSLPEREQMDQERVPSGSSQACGRALRTGDARCCDGLLTVARPGGRTRALTMA